MATVSQLTNSNTNLPTITRLYAEDYKTAPSWFTNQFIQTMNLFMAPIAGILNQAIDITQNTSMEKYQLVVSNASATGATNATSFSPKKFIGSPFGVIVAQCYDTTAASPTAIGNPVTIDWYFNGGQVKILAIYGLTAAHNYALNLLIF